MRLLLKFVRCSLLALIKSFIPSFTFFLLNFPFLPSWFHPFSHLHIDLKLIRNIKMSKRPRSSELVDLRPVNLNRSPATSSSSSTSVSLFGSGLLGPGSGSGSTSDMSVESSCLSSSEREVEEIITRSMMLVGCPGCFMYVMLTDKSSQCPKCKNNVFLDFFKQQHG